MPIHDWTRVDAGTFHFFHMCWIASICDVLNQGLLPRNYYAMGEQRALGDEPDVLTLHAAPFGDAGDEADTDYHRRKQNSVVVRHVSGDRVVAMIEVVSWGNKCDAPGAGAVRQEGGKVPRSGNPLAHHRYPAARWL